MAKLTLMNIDGELVPYVDGERLEDVTEVNIVSSEETNVVYLTLPLEAVVLTTSRDTNTN